jgi:hypothetical protein
VGGVVLLFTSTGFKNLMYNNCGMLVAKTLDNFKV